MTLRRSAFLAGYYATNIVRAKLPHPFVRRSVARRSAEWEALREACAGQESWLVIGNGPSLSIGDLELLGHIPSVASNKITLLYDQTDWRPRLYTIGDPLLVYKLPAAHYDPVPLALVPSTIYAMARTRTKLPWKNIPLQQGEALLAQGPFLPDPVQTGLIGARTVTMANLQLAMWCGAKTVYVIGCDHNYNEEQHGDVTKLAHISGASNHFHPDYRKPGEVVNNAPIGIMEQGYDLMRRIAEANGIRIVNITRRTALTQFEYGTVEQAVADTRG